MLQHLRGQKPSGKSLYQLTTPSFTTFSILDTQRIHACLTGPGGSEVVKMRPVSRTETWGTCGAMQTLHLHVGRQSFRFDVSPCARVLEPRRDLMPGFLSGTCHPAQHVHLQVLPGYTRTEIKTILHALWPSTKSASVELAVVRDCGEACSSKVERYLNSSEELLSAAHSVVVLTVRYGS